MNSGPAARLWSGSYATQRVTLMSTSKATAKSDSKQVATVPVLEKQQELIRELHDLLTRYAPTTLQEKI